MQTGPGFGPTRGRRLARWSRRLASAAGARLRPALMGLTIAVFAVFVAGSLLRRGHPGQIPLLDVGVFNAVCLLGALLCLLRGRSCERAAGWSWWVLSAALVTITVGNLIFSAITAQRGAPPLDSLADAFYL